MAGLAAYQKWIVASWLPWASTMGTTAGLLAAGALIYFLVKGKNNNSNSPN